MTSSLTTVTEKGDKAFTSTGSARINLFFHTIRGIQKTALYRLLDASFAEDSLDTLKLIFQTRDMRGDTDPNTGKVKASGGKGERRLFRQCLKYMAVKCPKTLIANLRLVPHYGRWDDLLELFYWDSNDVEEAKTGRGLRRRMGHESKVSNAKLETDDACPAPEVQREIQDAILELIKEQLTADLKALANGKSVSLCAKWLPSEGQHHDRRMKKIRGEKQTLKDKMQPQDPNAPYESRSLTKCIAQVLGVNKADYRKKYLSPLRKHLRIVERLMSAKEWQEIDYEKVPSQAMNRLKKAFDKNDTERFAEYKQKLQRGEAKVNAATLMAPQLVAQYFSADKPDDIIEAQWNQLVEDTRQLGTMERALALSDVSGSMSGEPMQVSVALGILISELSRSFKHQVITFETKPQWFQVTGATLQEKVRHLLNAPWGGSTNFSAAFRLILQQARELNIPAEDMPDTLYVISDMQFNEADQSCTQSSFEVLQSEYANYGYELPRVVFWNVRSNTSTFPAQMGNANVALVSGYSQGALKAVLSADVDSFTPYSIMRAAIDDTRYDALKIVKEEFDVMDTSE